MYHRTACLSIILSLLIPVISWANNWNLTETKDDSQVPVKVDQEIQSSDLEILRRGRIAELLKPGVNQGQIEELIKSLREDGSWPGIEYEDVSFTGWDNRIHLNNLVTLSRAYKKPESPFYENSELKDVIYTSIDFWIEHDFIADNWHSNEISGPSSIVRTLLLMDTELTETQTAELVRMVERSGLHAWGARPGGDLIKILGIVAERALFERDVDELENAIEIMAGEMKITSGRGLKPDYSFHHRTDRVTSVLSYGTGYASTFAVWASRLANTRFRFPNETIELLIDYFLDGISGTMVHGWYKDPGAMNRGMSRPGALNPRGISLLQNLLQASTYRKEELENLVQIRNGEQKPNLTNNRFFWHSEYFSHQRPNYFTSVRMHSARTNNMESPHGSQGLKQHYFADGANFISKTGEEYKDIFAVLDWQKIPGTTIVQKPSHPNEREIVKQGLRDFVGGVSDGVYGAAAFDFESPHDPLRARKSWFFFDEEFVSLGSGIYSDSEYPVATTLNQTLLSGDVVVNKNDKESVLDKGESTLDDVSWVYHDGVAYVFDSPTAVRLKNKLATGTWRDINHQHWATDEEVHEEVFTLWLDHGPKPREANYEYIVVPDIKVTEIEEYKENSEINVLSNTPEIQAVQHKGLHMSQIAFYEAGEIELNDKTIISTNNPGMIMVENSAQGVEKITVSDPTRLKKTFHLKLTSRFEGAGSNWKAEWNEEEGYSDILIMLPVAEYAGKSIVLENNPPLYTGIPPSFDVPNETETDDPSGKRYIGESYGGGIVYWVNKTREHALIAAETDQNKGIRWSNGSSKLTTVLGSNNNRITNARGDGIGAGEMNTQLIVAQLTQDDFYGNFAAKVCGDYQGNGYGDWYLPSKTELDLMFQQKDKIGGFANSLYWSSTEYGVGFAWEQYFYGYGGQYTSPKGSSGVRCVRKF